MCFYMSFSLFCCQFTLLLFCLDLDLMLFIFCIVSIDDRLSEEPNLIPRPLDILLNLFPNVSILMEFVPYAILILRKRVVVYSGLSLKISLLLLDKLRLDDKLIPETLIHFLLVPHVGDPVCWGVWEVVEQHSPDERSERRYLFRNTEECKTSEGVHAHFIPVEKLQEIDDSVTCFLRELLWQS